MSSTPDPIAPGAAGQLTNLAVAVVVAAAVALLAGLALAAWRRWRHGAPAGDAAADRGDGQRTPDAQAPAGAAGPRLLGGVLVLLLALPAAVAVRQLWPHPDLGWRLLVLWLLAVLPPAAVWLALAARGRGGGSP